MNPAIAPIMSVTSSAIFVRRSHDTSLDHPGELQELGRGRRLPRAPRRGSREPSDGRRGCRRRARDPCRRRRGRSSRCGCRGSGPPTRSPRSTRTEGASRRGCRSSRGTSRSAMSASPVQSIGTTRRGPLPGPALRDDPHRPGELFLHGERLAEVSLIENPDDDFRAVARHESAVEARDLDQDLSLDRRRNDGLSRPRSAPARQSAIAAARASVQTRKAMRRRSEFQNRYSSAKARVPAVLRNLRLQVLVAAGRRPRGVEEVRDPKGQPHGESPTGAYSRFRSPITNARVRVC